MRNPKPIPIPGGPDHHSPGTIPLARPRRLNAWEQAGVTEELSREKDEAVASAKDCVAKLTTDPNDVPAREKLACLFTERLDKVKEGLEQLTLLLNMPDQPDQKKTEWLRLSAEWHIDYRRDVPNGRKILERLIREFPQSAEAVSAQRRLKALDGGAATDKKLA